jgi:hypothetical protein
MKTNCDLTIYNVYVDAATRSEKYVRAQVVGVYWENRRAVNKLRSANLSADKAMIIIPFGRGTAYLEPVQWQALTTKTGKWTLQEGDIIVKGLVSDELSSSFTASALEKKYNDVLKITSVDVMDQGSLAMRHWRLGAS